MKPFLTKLVLRSAWIVGVQFLLPPLFVAPAEWSAQAAELSKIRERGYITIGVKDNRAPLGFLDASGNIAGFEIDIAERLAEELLGDRTAVELVPVTNAERLDKVVDDEVDIVIAALTITPARRRLINFSDPYYLDGAAFITQRANFQTLRDLSLAKIAILDGSSSVPRVRYILPGAELIGVSSYQEGRSLLAAGSVDAFVGDVSVLTGWVSSAGAEENSSYRILPSIISAEPLAIAIPKGTQHSPLKAEINQALRRWYAEGWLQARAAHWGLPSEAAQFIRSSPESAEELSIGE